MIIRNFFGNLALKVLKIFHSFRNEVYEAFGMLQNLVEISNYQIQTGKTFENGYGIIKKKINSGGLILWKQ